MLSADEMCLIFCKVCVTRSGSFISSFQDCTGINVWHRNVIIFHSLQLVSTVCCSGSCGRQQPPRLYTVLLQDVCPWLKELTAEMTDCCLFPHRLKCVIFGMFFSIYYSECGNVLHVTRRFVILVTNGFEFTVHFHQLLFPVSTHPCGKLDLLKALYPPARLCVVGVLYNFWCRLWCEGHEVTRGKQNVYKEVKAKLRGAQGLMLSL